MEIKMDTTIDAHEKKVVDNFKAKPSWAGNGVQIEPKLWDQRMQ